jgi:hypothetical protein
MSETLVQEVKKPQELLNLLNELRAEIMNSWMRMRDMVNRTYEMGKKCGLEKDIIRNDFQNFSNRLISERLLRNLLPAELKHSKST